MYKKIKYLYFGGNSLHTGLYVELVQALNKSGLDVTLLLKHELHFAGLLSYILTRSENIRIGPNNLANIKARLDGKVITIPYIKGLHIVGKVIFLFYALCVFFIESCRCNLLVVHAKNVVEYTLYIKKFLGWKKIKVIGEFEGDLPSEIEYVMGKIHHNGSMCGELKTIDNAKKMQRWTVEKSDLVICVTERLKNLICERFSISAKYKFKIYPTFASSQLFHFDKDRREKTRKALDVDGRFIVIYCGNLRDKWQVPELLAEMFIKIRDISPNALFYILTPQSDQVFILPFLGSLNISDYVFAEVDHSKIIDYLCMADCALILREKHIMNEVASPGKFAEYALTGLPVVMTNSIGYYSDAVKGRKDTLILENLHDEEVNKMQIEHFVIDQIPKLNREDFALWSSERFSLETRVVDLIKAYRYVAESL